MSETTGKHRVRIDTNGLVRAVDGQSFVGDSFQNFSANLGYGTANISSGATYGFNPISRNHTQLEWMYRGSWLVRKVVDVVADDMTRARIQVTSEEDPGELETLDNYWNKLRIWQRLNQTLKWARLYGGCLAVIMIDGQRPSDPFTPESVGEGKFKGLLVLDRWMANADLSKTVQDYGVDFGQPMYYDTVADSRSIPNMRIHHSRCIRIDGIELPYWQQQGENGWGISVIEPMFDRMIAFDSTTQGAAQLVYKAHLRTYYVDKLRDTIGLGGKSYQALLAQVNMIRMMQNNEGMTLLDATDRMESSTYSFAGLSDMLVQFGQQLGGAADIPLTRLFGQAPAGLNSTGEADLRNYYDMINAQQEARLRPGIETLRAVTYRSRLGRAPKKDETFKFTSLMQLSDGERASVAGSIVQAASSAFESQLMTREAAMKEVKQWATITGFGSNITDEDIKEARGDEPPTLGELTGGRLDTPLDILKFKQELKAEGKDPDNLSEAVKAMLGVAPGPASMALPPLGGASVAGGEPAATVAALAARAGQSSVGNSAAAVAAFVTHDRAALREFHDLNIVIETAKGELRMGPGWRVSMPCDYGYIMGTSSNEGPQEQMDCFVGPDTASDRVFIIYQVDPKTNEFDEHKVMLQFPDGDAAIAAYDAAFSDNSGPDRMDDIRAVSVSQLKVWLREWKHGLPGNVAA